MKSDNYYDILQVPTHASQREIRTSYLRLCKQFHPDVISHASNILNEEDNKSNSSKTSLIFQDGKNLLQNGHRETQSHYESESSNQLNDNFYFEKIKEAYAVLSNREERLKYDSNVLRDLVMQHFSLSDLQWRDSDNDDFLKIQVECRCGTQRWILFDLSSANEILVECEQCSSFTKITNDILE